MISGGAWFAGENIKEKEKKAAEEAKRVEQQEVAQTQERTLGDCLEVDDIWVEFSKNLIGMATDANEGVAVRVKALRKAMASDLGFILPEIRLTDNQLLKMENILLKFKGSKRQRPYCVLVGIWSLNKKVFHFLST